MIGNLPVLKCFNIKAKLDFENRPLRIMLLSDLHNTIYGKDQSGLVRKIRSCYPDLIMVAGDMYDNRRSSIGATLLLRSLPGIAPTYFVTGNHEFDPGVYRRLKPRLERFGIRLLEDSYETIEVRGEKIVVAGVSDPAKWLADGRYNQSRSIAKAFEGIHRLEGYKILLTHRPERVEKYLAYPFDLVLAGHTHGGQVRIPFTNQGVYARNQGILPKYARGLYEFGNQNLVVGCGLSRFYLLPRVFNPPELVLVEVGRAKGRIDKAVQIG